ncbi:MAG: hypothetical protein J6S16_03970 [Bacteroidales bacterium]|nr:hypothetical protein [Bacteroidales bacterium]
MKKILLTILAICAISRVDAQVISTGNHWFDGSKLYTSQVLDNGEIYSSGMSQEGEAYCFKLRKLDYAPGEYMLIPANVQDDAPFRAQYGWRVQYIRQSGMNFLAVRNRQDVIVWTLVLTPSSNLEEELASERFAESQPVDEMLTDYLMNTTYLARFDKYELLEMYEKLEAMKSHTIITRTNMNLIASEIEVVESERELLLGDVATEAQPLDEYFALVSAYFNMREAMEYISFMGYPTPAVYGTWGEYDRTFVVLPGKEDTVLEIWDVELNGEFVVIPSGEKPIIKANPGQPLCFSYMPPEGMPGLIVVCRKANGDIDTWVPVFSGMDGSLMTDDQFVDGTPVG